MREFWHKLPGVLRAEAAVLISLVEGKPHTIAWQVSPVEFTLDPNLTEETFVQSRRRLPRQAGTARRLGSEDHAYDS